MNIGEVELISGAVESGPCLARATITRLLFELGRTLPQDHYIQSLINHGASAGLRSSKMAR